MLRVHAGAIPERTQCTRGAIYYAELTCVPLEQQAEEDCLKRHETCTKSTIRLRYDACEWRAGAIFLVNAQHVHLLKDWCECCTKIAFGSDTLTGVSTNAKSLVRLVKKWKENNRVAFAEQQMYQRNPKESDLTLSREHTSLGGGEPPSAVYSVTWLLWAYIRLVLSLFT